MVIPVVPPPPTPPLPPPACPPGGLRIEAEEDFKLIPRLRWHLDVDGCPVATCRPARLRRDHLYFHGPGVLGVYYERWTRAEASGAVGFWRRKFGVPLEQHFEGLCDGLMLFRPRVVEDIPREFFYGQAGGRPFEPAPLDPGAGVV